VREGDLVAAGQPLAQMDSVQLEAQYRQAQAKLRRATIGIDTAGSLATQREAEKKTASAVISQRGAEVDAADRKL
jgi:HlyD family secretion protein